MNPKAAALQARTHQFFITVIALCRTVDKDDAGESICRQLLDSAGATDSNYRAACKARSKKEFIARIGVAAEEADESLGWLIALRDARIGDQKRLAPLIDEAHELTSIFVKSGKTASERLKEEESRRRGAVRSRRPR